MGGGGGGWLLFGGVQGSGWLLGGWEVGGFRAARVSAFGLGCSAQLDLYGSPLGSHAKQG